MVSDFPDIQALARKWANDSARQQDNLVAMAVLHYNITDPTELTICHAVTPEGGRLWVEPMSTKFKDDRLTHLREENTVLRARIAELEAEAARLKARDAALREVIFSLDYAIGQWEQHVPPGPRSGFDVLAYLHDMRRIAGQ